MDRNNGRLRAVQNTKMSLSARRAWIEMPVDTSSINVSESGVALRKESVDRNSIIVMVVRLMCKSLSARRAWIEIQVAHQSDDHNDVALRKESVDRNNLHCVEEVSGDTVALRKESVDRNIFALLTVLNLLVALRKESVDRN